MKLLLLAGSPSSVARVLPFCPDGAEVTVRADPYGEAPAAEACDVAIGCDTDGHAMLAGAPEAAARVALVAAYGLDLPPDAELGHVDRWAVGHVAVTERLRERGVAAEAIEVTGIPLPSGSTVPADGAAARTAAGLGPDETVVVVRTDVAPDELGSLIVQLTLLHGSPWILFDVGDDVAAASRLRAEVPAQGLRAKMFASGPQAGALSALGDLAVVPPSPWAVARAVAGGAATLVLGRPDRGSLDGAIERGAVRVCTAMSRLAADVDLLRTPALASAREAARALAVPDATERFRALIARAAAEREALAAQRRRRGLPVGLEDLSAPDPGPRPAPRPAPDIDAELAELRKRIGKT